MALTQVQIVSVQYIQYKHLFGLLYNDCSKILMDDGLLPVVDFGSMSPTDFLSRHFTLAEEGLVFVM